MLSSYTTGTFLYFFVLARWGSSRARRGFPCARSPQTPAFAFAHLVPTKRYQRFALRATRPKLDGVGGRNVIQLHYGYVSLFFSLKSYYILLFFAWILQAFMVYYF